MFENDLNDDCKCKNCIWYDKCHGQEICEDYYPVQEDEQCEQIEKQYIQDLHDRQTLYMEQVKEQNS